jgi:hypothetical protein
LNIRSLYAGLRGSYGIIALWKQAFSARAAVSGMPQALMNQRGRQSYIEDCQVCCKPNVLRVEYDLSSQEFFIAAALE